jgi:hypothetical protein
LDVVSRHRKCLCAGLLLAACDAPTASGAGTFDGGASDAGWGVDAAVLAEDAASAAPDAAFTAPSLPYYEVPVDDPTLAPHAFFAVPDVHYVRSGEMVTLTYDFPADLSGVLDQTVELSGPIDAAGNATLAGAQGVGQCTVAAGVVRCVEMFSALPIDPGSARAQVARYGTDPAMRAARLAVVDRFITDPIGIVVFDLATASEPSGGD